MPIMVDELRKHRGRKGVRGGYWCHLTTDGDLDELHEFAQRLGLKREWFQDHPHHPHYDMMQGKRNKALKAGALFVPAAIQARNRLRRLGKLPRKAAP